MSSATPCGFGRSEATSIPCRGICHFTLRSPRSLTSIQWPLFDFLDDPRRLGPDLWSPFDAGATRLIGAMLSVCSVVKYVWSQASDLSERVRDLSSATADSGHHLTRKRRTDVARESSQLVAQRDQVVVNVNAGCEAGSPIARPVRNTYFGERRPRIRGGSSCAVLAARVGAAPCPRSVAGASSAID